MKKYSMILLFLLTFTFTTPMLIANPCSPRQRNGDLNQDGLINLLDYAIIANHWLSQNCMNSAWCDCADIDLSGNVNISDLTILADRWLNSTFNGTVILGSPTDTAITASLLSDDILEAYIEYGIQSGIYTNQTALNTIQSGTPLNLTIQNLLPNTRYYYRLCFRSLGQAPFNKCRESSFRTQPPPGAAFTFTVQSDPHLGDTCNTDLYATVLQNITRDAPDFHIDLGDTFMTEKITSGTYSEAMQMALNHRFYFDIVANSAALFLVNGNHEGELGWKLNGTADNMAVYSALARLFYYPTPQIGAFYSGSTTPEPYVGLRNSYYSWTWGDALFIVLDPFWFTTTKPSQNHDCWNWTLGLPQYNWLKQTLQQSTAGFKFVFIHNLFGEELGRGGIEKAPYYEWGGKNTDDTWGFDTHRPGWYKPIHDLLLENHVSIVFHGHDHLFIRQSLDGIAYQLVPVPRSADYNNIANAQKFGYLQGDILGNSGHLRVAVSAQQTTVDYVRAYLPGDGVNGQVAFTYSIAPPEKFNGSIILGRPTNNSITASLLSDFKDWNVYLEYGAQPKTYTAATSAITLSAGIPAEIKMENLQPNTRYYYRLRYRPSAADFFSVGDEFTFHTQRAPDSTFTFDIQADSHLYDRKCDSDLYWIALQNVQADQPDFYLDLGDTFGDDHDPAITYPQMLKLHLDQRPYFGFVCRSSPLFLCIGNHEAECGAYLNDTPNNLCVYGTNTRNYYYPNPYPDGFYSGNDAIENYAGRPQNYYAWTWGDALFVVLDAYRYIEGSNPKPSNFWDWSLGETQYNWFKKTLQNSSATFKFVFAHHVLGQSRGATRWASYYEWGGLNADGSPGFASHRPGWSAPIHQLMAENHVTIFFQGHDHLFAKEELDGIIYQECPMPSDSTYNIGSENEDDYSGIILENSGHLRVTVSPAQVTVDYISVFLPEDEDGTHVNGQTAYSYTIQSQ